MTFYDDEADMIFRGNARDEGWLAKDPHPPGNGRGLWAYYRSLGIVPPEVLEREIPKREYNNWKWGEDFDD